MVRTSPLLIKAPRNRKGFTLLELIIVVTLIALFAIAIVPNVLNQQRSGQLRSFYSGARRIVSTARETAISQKTTVTLTYDDADGRLVLSRKEADSDQATELAHLNVPGELQASGFRVGTADTNSGEWSIAFYSDGTSDGGGLSFDRGNGPRSLAITTTGYCKLVDGELPDTSTEKWEAGSYEQRL